MGVEKQLKNGDMMGSRFVTFLSKKLVRILTPDTKILGG